MSKQTEDLLRDYKTSKYDDIPIPHELDIFIEKGIRNKRIQEKAQWRKKFSFIAASLMIFMFLTAIRISPAFASYISDIPGLDYIVKLIHYDKGLKMAIENEFIQRIGVSDTHEDITVTVDHIIVDESRMVIFYTVENKGDHPYLQPTDVLLRDEKGEVLPVSLTYGGFIGINFNEERRNSEQVDISFQPENHLPDTVTLEVHLQEAKQSWEAYTMEQENKGNSNIDDQDRFTRLASTWRIDIPIDKEKFKNLKEAHAVDKTISVHGQKIAIKQFVIHPTRMELDMVYDENNPMKIFSIENLRITDEKGTWQTISNGITASHLDENTRRYYFQSGYFAYPKELYVEGDGIYALDKERIEVVVDFKKEVLLEGPDNRIKLKGVVSEEDYYVLRFDVPKYPGNKGFDIFDRTFKDAKGQEFETDRTGFSASGEGAAYSEVQYYIPKHTEMDPIVTIKISHYPNLIEAPFRVRIK